MGGATGGLSLSTPPCHLTHDLVLRLEKSVCEIRRKIPGGGVSDTTDDRGHDGGACAKVYRKMAYRKVVRGNEMGGIPIAKPWT